MLTTSQGQFNISCILLNRFRFRPHVERVVVAFRSLLLLQLLLCNKKKFVSLLNYKYHGEPLDECRFTFWMYTAWQRTSTRSGWQELVPRLVHSTNKRFHICIHYNPWS